MKNDISEERPSLRIENPPDWWIEKRQKEIQNEEEKSNKRKITIIDLTTGEESPDVDSNGCVVIRM